MPKSKKEGKKNQPLIVKGSFDDLIKASVSGNPTPKAKKKKEDKKKAKKKPAPNDLYNYREDERELGGEG